MNQSTLTQNTLKTEEQDNSFNMTASHNKAEASCSEIYEIYDCAFCEYETPFWKIMQNHMKFHIGQDADGGCGETDEATTMSLDSGERPKSRVSPIRHVQYKKQQNKEAETVQEHAAPEATDPSPDTLELQTIDSNTYSNVSTSASHEQPQSSRRHKCTYSNCDYITKKNSYLEVHLRIHTGEKPYVCKYTGCGYRSTQRSNLARHTQTHNSGEKPYVCGYTDCEFKTAYRTSLDLHIRRYHTGEKPYVCKYTGCEYRAAQQSTLNQHTRARHTCEKPYVCGYTGCEFKTARKTTLVVHIRRRHTGEKPHSCKYCGYKNASSFEMKKHKTRCKRHSASDNGGIEEGG